MLSVMKSKVQVYAATLGGRCWYRSFENGAYGLTFTLDFAHIDSNLVYDRSIHNSQFMLLR